MEITAQQYLSTSRKVETTRPPASFYVQTTPNKPSTTVRNDEPSAELKREQQQYDQAVQQQLHKLSARDAEVRAHEAAHVAAGGQYVSRGPQYTYQRGPNGRYYAIGGEVNIDTSAIPGNPEATLDKAETVRRAALAPAEPSPQDLQVAANAARLASRARIEIAIQQREQQNQSVRNSEQGEADSNRETVDTGSQSYTANSTLAEPARDVFDIVA